MIVRAECSNSEEFIATTHHEYIFTIRVPQNRSAIFQVVERKTAFKSILAGSFICAPTVSESSLKVRPIET